MSHLCPTCNSDDVQVRTSSSAKFQARNNRECHHCGTVWTPPCTKWGGVLSLLAGAALFVVLVLGSAGELASIRAGRAITVSLWSVLIFIFLLVGSGSAVAYVVIIRQGTPPTQDQTPPTARVRKEIRWFHLVVAILLPIIAFPWGLSQLLREKWRSALFLMGVSALSLAVWIYALLHMH